MPSKRTGPFITLDAESLLYKYGNFDGEEPEAVTARRWPYVPGRPPEFEWPGGWEAMLVALLREHVIPRIPVPVETYDLDSHNPIRARRVGDVDAPETHDEPWPDEVVQLLRPITVTLSWEQLLDAIPAAQAVADDWTRRYTA